MTMTDTTQQIPAGALFDVPGVGSQTQWFDDTFEPTQNLALTWSQGSQSNVNGIQQFKQTDVVTDWLMEVQISYNFTAGAAMTLTPSPYAPHNFIGAVLLNIQNQYNSLNCPLGGIDVYIFNLLRPTFRQTAQNILGFAPSGGGAGSVNFGYPSAINGQVNLLQGGTNAQFPSTTLPGGTSATGTFSLYYRIPASQVLDVYYNLVGAPGANTASWDGTPPHQAYVSPQYMAGTARVITPQLTLAPLLTAQGDVSPYSKASADVLSTATATGTLTFKRRGVYSSNSPATAPAPYNWQYSQATTKFSINGTTQATIILPQNTGQVLGCYVRMWDPVANAPIQLSALTNIQYQFGSAVLRFNGTPQEWVSWWFRSGHRVLLPPGVFCFDSALDEHQQISNKRLPNTLTTTGIQIQLTFAAPTSAQAYAVLGTESLVLVA